MSTYSVDVDEVRDIIKVSFNNKEDYLMHYTTNYNGYKPPPLTMFKKMNMIDSSLPITFEYLHFLCDNFKYGMFNTDGDFKYERATQFEYDKFCYEKRLDNANAKLYKHMMMREKHKYVNI